MLTDQQKSIAEYQNTPLMQFIVCTKDTKGQTTGRMRQLGEEPWGGSW